MRSLRLVRVLVLLVLLLSLVPTGTVLANPPNGVDDLRGRWEFVVSDFVEEPLAFDIFINDLAPDPDSQTGNEYLAVGCMGSPGVDAITPMSLRATDKGNGAYKLNMLSTVIPPGDEQPFVIQFLSTVLTNGSGVPDDVAGGSIRTDFFEGGELSATHHDRRRTECPPVGDIPTPGLYFAGDVYVHHGYWGDELVDRFNLLEGFTNIVSTGMRVERPDGSVVIVPHYTDIFSSQVDFISQFRYLQGFNGDPISGQTYTFTLLDALGNPIPGTTRSDVWTGCETFPPPRNFVAAITPGVKMDLSWDPTPTFPGFDPANEVGFYQIGVWPWEFEGGTQYGANVIKSTSHVIPWLGFGGWAEGDPDGYDNGSALGELEDGNYQLLVEAFSRPNPANAGDGHECSVKDYAEQLYFNKTADSITVLTP